MTTMPFLLIEMPGGGEMIIILVVVLLLFGGKKIPELMRGLGRGVREFNDAKSTVTKELEEGMKVPEHTPTNNFATTAATSNTPSSNTIEPPSPTHKGSVSSHTHSSS